MAKYIQDQESKNRQQPACDSSNISHGKQIVDVDVTPSRSGTSSETCNLVDQRLNS